jgi:predicted PhzF superfamily epimerase YddE/YHI9
VWGSTQQVQAVGLEWQFVKAGDQGRRRARLFGRQPALRHAVGAQAFQLRPTQLQRMKTEQVGHCGVQALLLPVEQVAAQRALQPGGDF